MSSPFENHNRVLSKAYYGDALLDTGRMMIYHAAEAADQIALDALKEFTMPSMTAKQVVESPLNEHQVASVGQIRDDGILVLRNKDRKIIAIVEHPEVLIREVHRALPSTVKAQSGASLATRWLTEEIKKAGSTGITGQKLVAECARVFRGAMSRRTIVVALHRLRKTDKRIICRYKSKRTIIHFWSEATQWPQSPFEIARFEQDTNEPLLPIDDTPQVSATSDEPSVSLDDDVIPLE